MAYQLKLGSSRYISGRNTGARPALNVGGDLWETTTNIGLTKGYPLIRSGAGRYVREYFGANITVSCEMRCYAHGSSDPNRADTKAGIRQEVGMYISEIRVYGADGASIGASITSNFRSGDTDGSGGESATAWNDVNATADGNTTTFIGYEAWADAADYNSASAEGFGSVSIVNNTGMATRVEVRYGCDGRAHGDASWAQSDATSGTNTIVEGYVNTYLNGGLISSKAYDDNDEGGDFEVVGRFMAIFTWNGSSWVYSESAW